MRPCTLIPLRDGAPVLRPPALSAPPPPQPVELEELAEASAGPRRYLQGVPYLLPRDEEELRRLDFQHYLLRQALGADYLAPLPEGLTSIFDAGCGSGLWARMMAKRFPAAQIVAFDIEPPPHLERWPARCHFVEGNLLKPLPFLSHSFDFVHQRMLGAAIPAYAWPGLICELLRVTRPGGLIELVEFGATFVSPGPVTRRLSDWLQTVAWRLQIDLSLLDRLEVLLQRLGVGAVQKRSIVLPIGVRGGRLGQLLACNLCCALRGLKERFCRLLGLAPALFDQMLCALPLDWGVYRTSLVLYVYYGQKLLKTGESNVS
jgi:SAM-dependent methyltransferase